MAYAIQITGKGRNADQCTHAFGNGSCMGEGRCGPYVWVIAGESLHAKELSDGMASAEYSEANGTSRSPSAASQGGKRGNIGASDRERAFPEVQ